jgi:hypothetical protein
MKWNNTQDVTFNGKTYCNNSTNTGLGRFYSGNVTPTDFAGVKKLSIQLQQNLGGGTYGETAGTYLVTISLESGDFQVASRLRLTLIVEWSNFSGGKSDYTTLASSNLFGISLSQGGLLEVLTTDLSGNVYRWTQLQIVY